ncbi:MAG: DUF5666 domain-containing protein [Patescibacteria group bacterium]
MRTLLAAALFFFAATPAFALTAQAGAPLSELHITAEGKFSAKNVVVLQKSGTTLFCRGTWGNAFVRITVLTTPDTIPALILRNHGGTTTVEEIQQGDLISVEGSLVPAADSLQINAKKIVDYSLNKEPKNVAGVIKSLGSGSFVLPNKTFGNTAVTVGTSTITKGVRTISFGELAAKDKVLSVSGTYDYAQNTLAADSITIYQDKSVFNPRTFEGAVRSISGTALPASLVIDTPTASYTVYLPAGAQVLSKNRAPVELSRFAPGDKVRVYGSVREDNLATIDASIVRDLNF